MSAPASDAHRRRFTSQEVLEMVHAGILAEDEPVELIDGELIVMSPQGPAHRGLTVVLRTALEKAFGPGHHVQDHSPLACGLDSLPEPDVAVVRGGPRDYLAHLPTGADVALVVELSVTTQRHDLAKAAVYARAGVPVYWNLDIPARTLHVHSNPMRDGAYRTVTLYRDGDQVQVPGTGHELAVEALLP